MFSSKDCLLEKLELVSDNKQRDMIIEKGLENAKRFSWDSTFQEYNEKHLGVRQLCVEFRPVIGFAPAWCEERRAA